MKKILFYFLTIFITTTVLSQSCDVNVDSLKGQYKGGCKNGVADGNGTATGTDSYTGNFKNGYPDGEGKYTWKNGNTYEGSWKMGLFNGDGTLTKVNNTDKAVVMTGFWRKGNYVGKHEKPYFIHSQTNNITDISIRKIVKKESTVTITIKSITGGAADATQPIIPKVKLIEVQTIEGRFSQEIPDETSLTYNSYTFRDVTFPFYAIFSFQKPNINNLDVERAGIELFEDGKWNIQVNIDN